MGQQSRFNKSWRTKIIWVILTLKLLLCRQLESACVGSEKRAHLITRGRFPSELAPPGSSPWTQVTCLVWQRRSSRWAFPQSMELWGDLVSSPRFSTCAHMTSEQGESSHFQNAPQLALTQIKQTGVTTCHWANMSLKSNGTEWKQRGSVS